MSLSWRGWVALCNLEVWKLHKLLEYELTLKELDDELKVYKRSITFSWVKKGTNVQIREDYQDSYISTSTSCTVGECKKVKGDEIAGN